MALAAARGLFLQREGKESTEAPDPGPSPQKPELQTAPSGAAGGLAQWPAGNSVFLQGFSCPGSGVQPRPPLPGAETKAGLGCLIPVPFGPMCGKKETCGFHFILKHLESRIRLRHCKAPSLSPSLRAPSQPAGSWKTKGGSPDADP